MPLPTTPFEVDPGDYATWTTLAEETTFLADLASQSDRVSVRQVGTDYTGLPIWEVRVGYPLAPTDEELRNKDGIFISGCQHGNEPSGRESVMQFIRDLAETADLEVQAYLEDHPIVSIPTANAVGFKENERYVYQAGPDPNRDHFEYKSPASTAIGVSLREFKPVIVIDLHERGFTPEQDMQTLGGTNPEIHTDIKTLSDQAALAARNACSTAGFVTGVYPGGTGLSIFRNNAGLRGCIPILMEAYGQGKLDGMTRKQAVQAHIVGMEGVRVWHSENAEQIAQAVLESRRDHIAKGFSRAAIASPELASPPAGYVITEAQRLELATLLDLHWIDLWEQPDGDYFVPLSQRSRIAIVSIMDAVSTLKTVTAVGSAAYPSVKQRYVKSHNGSIWQSAEINLGTAPKQRRIVDGLWV